MTVIRRAEVRDIGDINILLGQVLLVHHNGRPDLFKAEGAKYSDDQLAEIIRDDNRPVFVYEEDGRVIAHCFCMIKDCPETGAAYARKTLFIDDLCVDEEVRGKHVGTQLYDYVKGWAAGHGFNNITLHVWECNPGAVEFYKSLGMQVQQYTMETILRK
ncbi:MAG: GNAT family N-acetyltransferase [Lachnospiraceae bacterium]|nr:GNAT family N-acetyltransferase [Lachnospiraceae bacterium]